MTTPASEYMTTPVLTVDAGTTLVDAAAAMNAEGMHSLVVISEDCRPEGVFTSTDLMAAVAEGAPPGGTTVGDLMTRDVVTVAPDESVETAAATMREADVSHLPVMDEQVVGILTETDLATYLAGAATEPPGAK
jgi:CBS domain-containing protein